jgi:TolB-like protein
VKKWIYMDLYGVLFKMNHNKKNVTTNILMIIFAALVLALAAGPTWAQEAKGDNKTKKSVRRAKAKKIAVLTFTNTRAKAAYQYLEESIAESTATSIAALKRFDIIERNAVKRELAKLKLKPHEELGTKEGAKIARRLGADIFIKGSFLALQDKVQINGRIFAAYNGKPMGGAKVQGELNTSLFDTLDQFAQKLAASLNKIVPRDRVVTVKEIVEKRVEVPKEDSPEEGAPSLRWEVALSPMVSANLGYTGEAYPMGYGGSFAVAVRDALLAHSYVAVQGGYGRFAAEGDHFDTMTTISLMGNIGYEWPLAGGLSAMPYVAAGIHSGRLATQEDAFEYLLPAYGGGLQLRWSFSSGIFTALDAFALAEQGSEVNAYAGGHWLVGIAF